MKRTIEEVKKSDVEPVEKVVDPNLNKFMKQDLPVTNNRIDPTADPEFDDEEEENVNVTAPVTDSTRNRIIYYLSKGLDQTGAAGLVKHFHEIGKMNEGAAREYLKVLSYINARTIDDGIVEGFIENACKITMCPGDTECREKAKKDHYIKECVATGLNDLLGQIGSLAGIVVFAFYCMSSYSGNNNIIPENVPETKAPGQRSITEAKTTGP